MSMPLSSLFAILLENLRPFFWPLAALLLLELAVLVRLWLGPRPLRFGRGFLPSLLFGVAVAAAVFLLAPRLTQADFSALTGWLDWGFLTLAAFAAGLFAMLLAWPWAVWWRLSSR